MKSLRTRFTRLVRSLTQGSPADEASLRVAVERLAAEVESWACSQPGDAPPPSGESGFSRLGGYLQSDAWRAYLEEDMTAALRNLVAAHLGAASADPRPMRPQVFSALDDVASALARIEDKGGLVPSWMPKTLVADARKRWACIDKINKMNSEQRSRCIGTLLGGAQ